MEPDIYSMERLVPARLVPGEITGQQTLALHIARYEFAAAHATPGLLLDIACGVGYGTKILYDRLYPNTIAIGVDVSETAVRYGQENFGNKGIQFIAADAYHFFNPRKFDSIVSLETIEHLPDPAGFISHLVKQLKPGGVFVGSVPISPSVDGNPYHLHDFTEKSFRMLLAKHGLKEVVSFKQIQSYNPFSVVSRKEIRERDSRKNLLHYYLLHPGSMGRRIWWTIWHGFTNQYLTLVCRFER